MKSYKNKKKKRRDLFVSVTGNMVIDKSNCTDGLQVYDFEERDNKKKAKTGYPGEACHANSGKVIGYFKASGVGNTTKALTW